MLKIQKIAGEETSLSVVYILRLAGAECVADLLEVGNDLLRVQVNPRIKGCFTYLWRYKWEQMVGQNMWDISIRENEYYHMVLSSLS